MSEIIDNETGTVLAAKSAPQVAPLQESHSAGALSLLNPDSLIAIAVQRGDSLDVLTKLMDLKDRHDATMARNAFNAAFAAFKAENVQVLRNKLITDGPLKGKKHAELADVCDAATEAMAKHGLSVSFRPVLDEKDWIKVACKVRHAQGHCEETEFGGPIDTGPGRNAIQARKSSVTYLERITMLLALGLAEHDADDDGAGGASGEADEGLMRRLIAEAESTKTDADALAVWKSNMVKLQAWPYAFEKFKAAVAAHRKALRDGGAA